MGNGGIAALQMGNGDIAAVKMGHSTVAPVVSSALPVWPVSGESASLPITWETHQQGAISAERLPAPETQAGGITPAVAAVVPVAVAGRPARRRRRETAREAI